MRFIPSHQTRDGTFSHLTRFLGTAVKYLRVRLSLLGLEAKEAGSHYGVAAGMVAGGLFIAVLGYVFLIIAAVFGIAAAFDWPHAWIIVLSGAALIHLGAAVSLFFIARHRLRTGAFPITIKELRKDQEWLTKLANKP